MPGAEQLTNITISANAKPLIDTLKQAGQAAQQFEDAIDKMSSTTERASQTVTMTASQYQKLVQSIDPAARSAAQYAQAEALIERAVQAGLSTREQSNRLLDLANQKYNTLAAQAQKAAAAEAATQQKALQQQAQAYNMLEASLDPAVAKKQQLAQVEKVLNDAVASGQASQSRANELLKTATQRYGELGSGVKVTSFQMMLAFDQVRQAGDQMIAGGGFLRPIIMQAPVAVQMLGGLSNTMGLLRQNIGAIVGYGGLAAFATALALIATAAERNQRSLNDLSNNLSKFGGDYKGAADTINAAARELAQTTSLGTQEAREAMQTFAASPGFVRTKQNFEDVTKTAQKFGIAFGENLQQAAGDISKIFADPVAAALDFAQRDIAGFNDAFHRHIQDLVNQGQKVQAVNEVYGKLTEALRNVNTAGTPLQAALKNLNEVLTAVGNGAGNASNGIGTGLTNALAGSVNAITSVVKALDSLLGALGKIGHGADVAGLLLIFGQMLSPIRAVEAAILRWAVAFGSARVAAAGAAAAVEATTAASAVGGAATAGGAVAAGAAGASGLVAMLGGAAFVTAIAAIVWAYFRNSGAQSEMETKAASAGFQKYSAGGAQLPRYYNQRTGEDLSTEQMNQRLLGQTLADSFGTRLDQWFAKNAPTWLGGAPANSVTGGGASRPSGPLTLNLQPGGGGQYADTIAAAEKKYNLPAGLLAGVANIETGGTFRPDLTNKTSGAGGLMQILESTGNKPGYGTSPISSQDRYDPVKSIEFAAQYIDNLRKSTGSLDKAIDVYSGGGYHLAKGAGDGGGTQTTAKTEPYTVTTPLEQAQRDLLGKPGDTAAQVKAINDQIKVLEDKKKIEGLDAEQIGALNEQERQLRAQLEGLKTPAQQAVEQTQRQTKAAQELNPETRAVTEAVQQLEEANRRLGRDTTPEERAAVTTAKLKELAVGYQGAIAAAEAETRSQQTVAAAWEQSAEAGNHAANAVKAWNQIVGSSTSPTEAQKAAVAALTAEFDKQTAAAQKLQLAQQKLQDEATSRALDTTRANLGGSAQQQAQAAAADQRRSQLIQQGIDPNSPEGQASIGRATANAAKTVDVDREKQAWQSVDQAAGSALDDIGNGLEEVLATGKWDNFASAAKQALGEITKTLLQMALINPLKNLLTGGRSNSPTLFDLFNGVGGSTNDALAGSAIAGGTTSPGNGGSSGFGGLLGSVGSWIGKGFSSLFGSSSNAAVSSAAGVVDSGVWDLPAAGAIGGDFALFAHQGGVVGNIGTTRFMPATAFIGAPRFHGGWSGGNGGWSGSDIAAMAALPPQFANDEVPAILQRGEMVLTKGQQRAMQGRFANNNGRPVINNVFHIQTPDADSFRKSQKQVSAEMARAMLAASRRL